MSKCAECGKKINDEKNYKKRACHECIHRNLGALMDDGLIGITEEGIYFHIPQDKDVKNTKIKKRG